MVHIVRIGVRHTQTDGAAAGGSIHGKGVNAILPVGGANEDRVVCLSVSKVMKIDSHGAWRYKTIVESCCDAYAQGQEQDGLQPLWKPFVKTAGSLVRIGHI